MLRNEILNFIYQMQFAQRLSVFYCRALHKSDYEIKWIRLFRPRNNDDQFVERKKREIDVNILFPLAASVNGTSLKFIISCHEKQQKKKSGSKVWSFSASAAFVCASYREQFKSFDRQMNKLCSAYKCGISIKSEKADDDWEHGKIEFYFSSTAEKRV